MDGWVSNRVNFSLLSLFMMALFKKGLLHLLDLIFSHISPATLLMCINNQSEGCNLRTEDELRVRIR